MGDAGLPSQDFYYHPQQQQGHHPAGTTSFPQFSIPALDPSLSGVGYRNNSAGKGSSASASATASSNGATSDRQQRQYAKQEDDEQQQQYNIAPSQTSAQMSHHSAGGGSGGGRGGSGSGAENDPTNAANMSGDGPAKFSRSKGACQQCRAVKQRCSGASKHPCERCQLYKLDCVFSKDPPPQSTQPRQPKKTSTLGKQASVDPETSQAVLYSLRVITEKLRNIEESLNRQGLGRTGQGSSSSVPHLFGGFDHDVKIPTHESVSGEIGDPISMVTNAIQGLDTIMAQTNSPFSHGSDVSSPQNQTVNGNNSNAPFEPDVPDAVSRGFVTVEEAQQLFDFYFARCAQWTPSLDAHQDRNMYHVRRRSTFLFHSILAVSSYFCYVPQGENGLRKYYAIVTTLVESLAPIIVSPNPAELTVDLLMGLLICILWKPVRCGSEMQLGPAGFSQLQAHSKLNPSSGYVLGGLALRISQLLGLSRRAAHPTPNDRASLNACRLWLWINLVDSQAALAEGKHPALDPADALRVTRHFASIKARPADVRLAALVELFAAVVPIVAMQNGSKRTDFRALYRANSVLDRLLAYWTPLIEDARKSGDPLACIFINTYVPFVRVVLNGDVFRTWLIRQKAEAKGQPLDLENARFTLTSEESHCLGFAVSAAEEMLYNLSTQSVVPDRGARSCQWAPRDNSTGHRPPLQLDAEAAKACSGAIDSILLVTYAFPPLFLAQLRAQNLINCDLDMAPEITNDLYSVGFPSRALLPASKFMRLLELSAEFYEVVSPNSDFPAVPQAQLLRTMACLSIPQSVPPGLQGFRNGELFTSGVDANGVTCMLPGQMNSANNNGRNQQTALDQSAQAKAYQAYMQQIANGVQPTNSNLPHPYNTMIFSTEGADRLEQIMSSTLPDPSSASNLLGSFAKIDADWNAYFNPVPDAYGLGSNNNNNGMSSTLHIGTSSNNTSNSGSAKLAGQSPESLLNMFGGSTSGTSPNNFYTPQNMRGY